MDDPINLAEKTEEIGIGKTEAPPPIELVRELKEIGTGSEKKFNDTQNYLAWLVMIIFGLAILFPLGGFLWKALSCVEGSVDEFGKSLEHLTNFALKIFLPIITLVFGFYYRKK